MENLRPMPLRRRHPQAEPLFPGLPDPRARWGLLQLRFPTFTELQDRLESQPAVTIVRWDWLNTERDEVDEEIDGQVRDQLLLCCWDVSRWVTFMLITSVDKSEEPTIWNWLNGPRALGAQRSMWEPFVEAWR